jgi:prepilin-type N-terminal cleavage/methylation domain-containing protein
MRNRIGFTMVELLVVLVIVGILAAIATPMYLANTKRARASEAVGALSLIRQAERDYYTGHNGYTADVSDITQPVPTGLDIHPGVTQYFSSKSYAVDVGGTFTKTGGTPPVALSAVNFVIRAVGSSSGTACSAGGTDCAMNPAEVTNYQVEMDNAGTIYVTYDGTNWNSW